MEDKKRLFWDFEDLKNLNSFSDLELQYIRNLIDEAIVTKRKKQFTTADKKFQIMIWINGNITIMNLIRDEMVLKPK